MLIYLLTNVLTLFLWFLFVILINCVLSNLLKLITPTHRPNYLNKNQKFSLSFFLTPPTSGNLPKNLCPWTVLRWVSTSQLLIEEYYAQILFPFLTVPHGLGGFLPCLFVKNLLPKGHYEFRRLYFHTDIMVELLSKDVAVWKVRVTDLRPKSFCWLRQHEVQLVFYQKFSGDFLCQVFEIIVLFPETIRTSFPTKRQSQNVNLLVKQFTRHAASNTFLRPLYRSYRA